MKTVSKHLTIISIEIGKEVNEGLKKVSQLLSIYNVSSYVSSEQKFNYFNLCVPPYNLDKIKATLEKEKISFIEKPTSNE